MVVGLALACGPTAASAVLAIADWSWLYMLMVPIAVATALVTAGSIPRTQRQARRFDAPSAALCAAIISLAHSRGLQTVAEGVETVEQMRWLHARGCDELQGFLLGRPVDFDEVLRVLARGGAPIPA